MLRVVDASHDRRVASSMLRPFSTRSLILVVTGVAGRSHELSRSEPSCRMAAPLGKTKNAAGSPAAFTCRRV